MQIILATILTLLIGIILLQCYRDRRKGALFSPLLFICVFYIYYILYPFYFSKSDIYGLGKDTGVSLLLMGGIINLLGIILGFKLSKPKVLSTSNSIFESNPFIYAVSFFLIGFCAYSSIKGFTFNVVTEQTETYHALEHIFNHTDMYVTGLISLFPAAACLFYASGKWKYNILLFVIAISIALMGGSRNRILLFLIPFVVFYHLYPIPKKVNYKLWVPIAIVFVIAMGVIEKTRNYNSGLDLERLNELKSEGLENTKASESELVYYFSAKVLDNYQDRPMLLGDVIGTAICLPIPRAIFPEKPNAQYLRDANIRTLGTVDYGAAYLNIVEGYIALGWIGVFFNGLILGWLSKKFWNNYKAHPKSIGAIMFLGLFNGVSYILISRGYLAQELLIFVYYIPVIYWMGLLVKRIIK